MNVTEYYYIIRNDHRDGFREIWEGLYETSEVRGTKRRIYIITTTLERK